MPVLGDTGVRNDIWSGMVAGRSAVKFDGRLTFRGFYDQVRKGFGVPWPAPGGNAPYNIRMGKTSDHSCGKPSVATDISKALGGFKKHEDYFESDRYVLSSAVGHLCCKSLCRRSLAG